MTGLDVDVERNSDNFLNETEIFPSFLAKNMESNKNVDFSDDKNMNLWNKYKATNEKVTTNNSKTAEDLKFRDFLLLLKQSTNNLKNSLNKTFHNDLNQNKSYVQNILKIESGFDD